MDAETIIIVAGIPAYALVMITIAKMALDMFFSQQQLQTNATATPPSK